MSTKEQSLSVPSLAILRKAACAAVTWVSGHLWWLLTPSLSIPTPNCFSRSWRVCWRHWELVIGAKFKAPVPDLLNQNCIISGCLLSYLSTSCGNTAFVMILAVCLGPSAQDSSALLRAEASAVLHLLFLSVLMLQSSIRWQRSIVHLVKSLTWWVEILPL